MSRALIAVVVVVLLPAGVQAAPSGDPNLSLPGKRYGFDVSNSWAAVDDASWAKVEAKGRIGGAPIDFAFFQATLGGTTISQFARNWTAVKKTRLLHGAYHVFDYRRTAPVAAQAQAYLKAVTGSSAGGSMGPGALPPVIDLEWITPGLDDGPYICANQARILSDVFEWINTVKAATGSSTVIVYTNGGFWKNLGNTKVLAGYPLWVADYNKGKAPSMPGAEAPCFPKNKRAEAMAKAKSSKSPWKAWTFWQYYGETVASSFKVEGLSQGAKDFVMFNGPRPVLMKLIKSK